MALLAMSACTPSPAQMAGSLQRDQAHRSDPVASTPIRFDLPDGSSLAGRVWHHPQPEHIVLGVHGFNDYSKAFESLAQSLTAELHATVYAYDQRGFGANPQPGIWLGTDALLGDLRHIAGQLRSRHPGLPVSVVGESMGGAVVLIAAVESPGLEADQIVLKAPAVWGFQSMPWYQRISLQFMNAVAPEMTLTGRGVQSLGITPTNDPDISRELSRDPLFIKATRVSSLAGVTALMGRAQTLPSLPPQRSLVLYGLRDRIIPPKPVCHWLTRLNAPDIRADAMDFVIYPEGWHLLTRQLQTRDVMQDLQFWLQQSPLSRRQNAQQARDAVCNPPP